MVRKIAEEANLSNYTGGGLPVDYTPYGYSPTTEQNILATLQNINSQLVLVIKLLKKIEKNLKA